MLVATGPGRRLADARSIFRSRRQPLQGSRGRIARRQLADRIPGPLGLTCTPLVLVALDSGGRCLSCARCNPAGRAAARARGGGASARRAGRSFVASLPIAAAGAYRWRRSRSRGAIGEYGSGDYRRRLRRWCRKSPAGGSSPGSEQYDYAGHRPAWLALAVSFALLLANQCAAGWTRCRQGAQATVHVMASNLADCPQRSLRIGADRWRCWTQAVLTLFLALPWRSYSRSVLKRDSGSTGQPTGRAPHSDAAQFAAIAVPLNWVRCGGRLGDRQVQSCARVSDHADRPPFPCRRSSPD